MLHYCKKLFLHLLFLLSTCYLHSCGSTDYCLSSHEQDQLGTQPQQDFLPSQSTLSVPVVSNRAKAPNQASHTQYDVETTLTSNPVDSSLRSSPRSLTAKVFELPLEAAPAKPIALFPIKQSVHSLPHTPLLAQTAYQLNKGVAIQHKTDQEARIPILLPAHASKVSSSSAVSTPQPAPLYGPFVFDGGKEVIFKLVDGQWQAIVKDTFLAHEETLQVVHQGNITTVLSDLQRASKVDIASRIHTLAADQRPRRVYVGALGLRGGSRKSRGTGRRAGEQQEKPNSRHAKEDGLDGVLGVHRDSSHACATLHTSKPSENTADQSNDTTNLADERPIVLSKKICHYIPLLNKIDMIQGYLMDTIDSFEQRLTGLIENSAEEAEEWREFIRISLAKTCKVVDKLYEYIGRLVVGKITAEACLHNAIMCRENYLMSHASHIDSWLYEECHELHNIVAGVEDHFNNTSLHRHPLHTLNNRPLLTPLFEEGSEEDFEMEGNIRELKEAIKEDIKGREEGRALHSGADQLEDPFEKTNLYRSPTYVPIPTDKRLFRLFFPENAKMAPGLRELKEAIREDMVFRLDTINAIIVDLFNICGLEQPFSEETINLLHHVSTRSLWPRLLGEDSKMGEPDECTPLKVFTWLLEKLNCNYTTQPDSVLQKIVLGAKLADAHCVLNYFKMKYRNDGAALLKTIHFAQTQQWFNNRTVKLYNTGYVEAGDMITRVFLPYMGLGIEKEPREPKKVSGVLALVSMFDRCRLYPEEQKMLALLEPNFSIPEKEAGDWQTPVKNIFSVNHAYEPLAKGTSPKEYKTAVQNSHGKGALMQNLHDAQNAATRIQKAWRGHLTREDAESVSDGSATRVSESDYTQESAPKILSRKQEKILDNLFSANAQLVSYRNYKNVWERLGGKIRSTAGGSHQELCNANGDVLGGIFKHNDNQTYGKRCIEKLLRRPMRRLMATKNLQMRDGVVLYESDSIAR